MPAPTTRLYAVAEAIAVTLRAHSGLAALSCAVYEGQDMSAWDTPNSVCVGAISALAPTGISESLSTRSDWHATGGMRREEGVVTCALTCQSGYDTAKVMRDRARDCMAQIELALHEGYGTLASQVPGLAWVEVKRHRVTDFMAQDGGACQVEFDVEYLGLFGPTVT